MTLKKSYDQKGYVIIPSGIAESDLEMAKHAKGPTQPDGYHWSDSPRIFDGWKSSQAVRDIAHSPWVLTAIKEVTGHDAKPFQTINFSQGTDMALHQDSIHFQTLPLNQIVGVWVALEDIHPDAGPLVVVPGSHEAGFKSWQECGLEKCEVGKQFESYAQYEAIWAEFNFDAVHVKRGDAIIWNVNLLHGGDVVMDKSRTRHSVAIHYFLDSARIGWAPMFSDPSKLDFCFKSTRWFDRQGQRRLLHESSKEVELF